MTTLLAALAIAAVALGCAQDPEVKKQKYLADGRAYLAQGKPNDAIIALKNALQIDPKFAEGLHALGLAYRAKGWGYDAARELQRALEVQPANLAARSDLVRVYLDLEAWDDALKEATTLGEAAETQGLAAFATGVATLGKGDARAALEHLGRAATLGVREADLDRARGDALARLGKHAEAEQAYRSVLSQQPAHVRAKVGLAQLLLQQGRRDAARTVLEEARATEPHNRDVRLVLAGVHLGDDRLADAIKELESLPRQTWSPRVVVALGSLYLRAERFDSAIQVLSPLARAYRQATTARYLLAHAYLGANRADDAIAEFQDLLKLAPRNPQLRFSLGLALARKGRHDDALKEFAAVATPFQEQPGYHLEVARAQIALGRLDQATKSADRALKLAPDDPRAFMVLGGIAAARGDLKAAQELYAKAASVDADYAPAHLALGRLHDMNKEWDAALQQYEAALEDAPTHRGAVRAKVAHLLRQKRAQDAIAFVQDTLKADPRNPDLLALLGQLHVATKQPRKAEEEYRRAVKLNRGHVGALLGLARLALAEKKETEAVGHLQQLLRERPHHLGGSLMLATIHNRSARYDSAIAVLEPAAQAATRPLPAVDLFLANLYLQKGRYADAQKRAQAHIDAPATAVPARMLLGQAHLAQHRVDDAIREFEQVNRLNPKIATNHLLLGRARRARGDVEQAKAAFQMALDLDPKLTDASVELAALTGGKLDPTLLAGRIDQLKAAVARDPGNVHVRHALASAYLLAGRRAESETELRQILNVAPDFVPANMGLAVLRFAEKKPDEAAAHLETVVRSRPNHVEANVLLARYHEAKGNRDRAIERLETVRRVNPGLQDVKLHLARLYAQAGKGDLGARLAQEVVESAPKSPAARLVLGEVHLRRGKTSEAIEAYTAAVRLKPDSPTALFGLASAYERSGNLDRALAEYRKVLSLRPDDPATKNNIAYLYATQKRNLDEALKLARQAQEKLPSSPSVLDTVGFVHLQRGENAEAAAVLGKAADLPNAPAAVHYHLGLAYHRLGRNEDARVALRRALQKDDTMREAPEIHRILNDLAKQG
ncbi:MAG TPA: tetratricopeptide repeat protein [Candidatus Tectomicrobia bacterium]|nr:tetratricopeptide repeat protein [Candidatus Tectomicrobia bacterium]